MHRPAQGTGRGRAQPRGREGHGAGQQGDLSFGHVPKLRARIPACHR
ncbi:hypothetical protein BN2537_15869 [Streptomyces venezuelae]|nr:hypothetical protein BN2537_15869 [Streptomyces venezuelae]